ncbi:MAG: hypothetical protein WBZ36_17745 [Candidatus Nitrosopolaris sp.]
MKRVVLVSAILALLIAEAATMMLMSNLALADWKPSFQQTPQIVTQSASPSGTAAIMAFNKIGSGSSSSSIYAPSSTAKDPYEHIRSDSINPVQLHDESPLASRTNTNNVDASAYTTTTTGNTGSTPTTRTIHPMTITSEPSPVQQQQQRNPTSPEVVTSQGPSQVTTVTLSLAGQTTCKPTELLRNSNCIPQPPTCDPIGISQDSKCNARPLHYHHMFMSIRSFRHR